MALSSNQLSFYSHGRNPSVPCASLRPLLHSAFPLEFLGTDCFCLDRQGWVVLCIHTLRLYLILVVYLELHKPTINVGTGGVISDENIFMSIFPTSIFSKRKQCIGMRET
ncbi:hypothetical protein RB195_004746 [Necator americanus]|uniref:Uncharacterized protein n=1 Tax=Necator americanus TaxID=51031 RepID=A0ABR1BJG3_NECAM